MSDASSHLREDLLSVMDRKNHWAWPHFNEGRASRPQLLLHFQQEFEIYVRDFPVLLSRVHARCPHPEVRQDLAENLYEEETGKLSRGVPHVHTSGARLPSDHELLFCSSCFHRKVTL